MKKLTMPIYTATFPQDLNKANFQQGVWVCVHALSSLFTLLVSQKKLATQSGFDATIYFATPNTFSVSRPPAACNNSIIPYSSIIF